MGGGERQFTDDAAQRSDEQTGDAGREPEVLRRAQEIAARLALPKPRRRILERRGAGRLRSVPFTGDADEIDLDRTLDVLAEKRIPHADDIVVRERRTERRTIALVVDVSGSMKGERIATAAATVGALAGSLGPDDEMALIAFWSDAALLSGLGPPPRTVDAVRAMLSVPTRGLTNVAFPLSVAADQLARSSNRRGRVLLLSDCVHNAGPDPREIAARLPRLDVIVDAVAEHDAELGRELAAEGRGVAAVARGHRDVGPALNRMLEG